MAIMDPNSVYDTTNIIILKGTINDLSIDILIDSGSAINSISHKLATEMNLIIQQHTPKLYETVNISSPITYDQKTLAHLTSMESHQ